jgi:hypothetical protein
VTSHELYPFSDHTVPNPVKFQCILVLFQYLSSNHREEARLTTGQFHLLSTRSFVLSPRRRPRFMPPQPQPHLKQTRLMKWTCENSNSLWLLLVSTKLVIDASNSVLDPHGPRDKRVELSDQPLRLTPSSSHTPCDAVSLWLVAGGKSYGFWQVTD